MSSSIRLVSPAPRERKVRVKHASAARPFLKWAGGKTQLLPRLAHRFPQSFRTYFEPFLGGGAVFFHLRKTHQSFPAVLLDLNPELINCYQTVRDDVDSLIEALETHQAQHSKKHYYKTREILPQELSSVDRAARLIYLNKTCYNGLYRVNSEGRFNVPMGSYKQPSILEEDVLRAASLALQGTEIRVGDFSDVLTQTKRDDFLYLDPPYHPISRTSSFTGYVVGSRGRPDFGASEQQRLAEVFSRLDKNGCRILLSNSKSLLISRMYHPYRVEEVEARRSINSNGSGRAAITELVIRNY